MASSGMGTQGQKSVVVDFKLLSGDAVKNIQDLNTKIANLQKTMQGLEQQGMQNSETYIKLSAVYKDLQQSVKANEKVLREELKQMQSNGDSINALRAQLKLARQEYENLSAAERDSAQGTALLDHIQELSDTLGGLEEKQRDWSRSVGHYADALTGLPISKVTAAFKGLSNGTVTLGGAFKQGIAGVKAFGASLKALMKIPIVAIISAIALVVMKLVDSFKKNDAAMTMVKKSMAMLKPPLQLLEKLFQLLTKAITAVMDALVKVGNAIMSLIPGLKQYVDANNDVIDSTERLEDAERSYAISSAKRQGEIEELKAKSTESDKYTVEQRRKFLEQAIELEKKELEEKKALAEERLRIKEREYALEIGYSEMTEEAFEELNDEMKNEITQLRVAVIEAENEFTQSTRRMRAQMANFNKQEEAERQRKENERKQAAKQAAQAAKQARKNELTAQAELNDMLVKGLQNLYDKEYAETKLGYQKQIDALKERYKTEEGLTKKAKADIRAQWILLEAEMNDTLAGMTKRHTKEMKVNMLQMRKNAYELKKSILKDTEAGWEAALSIDLKINEIDTKLLKQAMYDQIVNPAREIYNSAVKDLKSLTDEEIEIKYGAVFEERAISVENGMKWALAQLTAAYQKDLETAKVDYKNFVMDTDVAAKRTAQDLQNEHTKKLHDEGLKRIDLARKHAEILRQIEEGQSYDAYGRNEVEKTKILLEQSQERLRIAQEEAKRIADERQQYTDEELTAMYGSIDEYNNLVAESNLKVVEAENNVKNAIKDVNEAIAAQKARMIQTATTIMSAMNSIAGSMQGLFETMAESDEKYADYATAMAMMQILVSTAISIANAIQGATAAGAATGVAAPFTTPAFIAEMIAIVVGGITSATATLLKAKQQKQSAPKFAEGGLIGNKTTRRKDDTVDAKLTLGEYVIPAPVVDDFGVGFFDNLIGRKSFADRIRFNFPIRGYAEGGLVTTLSTPNFTAENTIDYDLMQEIMTNAVSEVQPIVSVKEINAVQKRVQVKETIARQ